ncbi:MAG: hypothetical protein GEV11_12035 [Streptosporangiales bacterium]|nr:hypothetical protein [Streptosporangiales bacterium]
MMTFFVLLIALTTLSFAAAWFGADSRDGHNWHGPIRPDWPALLRTQERLWEELATGERTLLHPRRSHPWPAVPSDRRLG